MTSTLHFLVFALIDTISAFIFKNWSACFLIECKITVSPSFKSGRLINGSLSSSSAAAVRAAAGCCSCGVTAPVLLTGVSAPLLLTGVSALTVLLLLSDVSAFILNISAKTRHLPAGNFCNIFTPEKAARNFATSSRGPICGSSSPMLLWVSCS